MSKSLAKKQQTEYINPKNKALIQSYVLTASKFDFQAIERRVLTWLVEIAQSQLKGQKLNKNFTINESLFGDYKVTLPISSLTTGKITHKQLKDQLTKMRNKTMEFVNDVGDWSLVGVIEKPEIIHTGIVQFEVDKRIYEAILDFSKGFREVELKTSLSLESSYAYRMYHLIAGQEPFIRPISWFRSQWRLENKYAQVGDFFKRTFDVAQAELNKKSYWSFTYTKIKEGREITKVRIVPIRIEANEDPEIAKRKLQNQTSLRWTFDYGAIKYFREVWGMEDSSIQAHKEKIKKIMEIDSFAKEWFDARRSEAKNPNVANPIGYLVNSMKKAIATHELKEAEEYEKKIKASSPEHQNLIDSINKIGKH